jgi:hypothetical protein
VNVCCVPYEASENIYRHMGSLVATWIDLLTSTRWVKSRACVQMLSGSDVCKRSYIFHKQKQFMNLFCVHRNLKKIFTHARVRW